MCKPVQEGISYLQDAQDLAQDLVCPADEKSLPFFSVAKALHKIKEEINLR